VSKPLLRTLKLLYWKKEITHIKSCRKNWQNYKGNQSFLSSKFL